VAEIALEFSVNEDGGAITSQIDSKLTVGDAGQSSGLLLQMS